MQFASPISDLFVGAWTNETDQTTDLWASLIEPSADETTFVQSQINPTDSAYVVALGAVADPDSSINHTIRFSYRNLTLNTAFTLTAQLREGYVSEASQGTLIASWVVPASSPWVTVERTLTPDQADLITDYTALALRFVADI